MKVNRRPVFQWFCRTEQGEPAIGALNRSEAPRFGKNIAALELRRFDIAEVHGGALAGGRVVRC